MISMARQTGKIGPDVSCQVVIAFVVVVYKLFLLIIKFLFYRKLFIVISVPFRNRWRILMKE